MTVAVCNCGCLCGNVFYLVIERVCDMNRCLWMNRSLAIASCVMCLTGLTCLTGNSVFGESAHSAGPKNLLPNASFELPLGQEKHQWIARDPGYGSPTNWTDMVNPLTLQLVATGQVSIGPPSETDPVIEEVPGTPEGSRAVAVSVSKNEPAHLTSPVVPMNYGQAYTLSVYARSDLPSAKLRLGVWNQPMDWRNEPDAQSAPISVTEDWQRYELTFNVSPYFHRGAVDLVFESSTEGKVWIDAVQLEVGPHATPFQTRYPVEVALTADTPFSGMLHLLGKPLALNLAHYSSREAGAWRSQAKHRDSRRGQGGLYHRHRVPHGRRLWPREVSGRLPAGWQLPGEGLLGDGRGDRRFQLRIHVYGASGDERRFGRLKTRSRGGRFPRDPLLARWQGP